MRSTVTRALSVLLILCLLTACAPRDGAVAEDGRVYFGGQLFSLSEGATVRRGALRSADGMQAEAAFDPGQNKEYRMTFSVTLNENDGGEIRVGVQDSGNYYAVSFKTAAHQVQLDHIKNRVRSAVLTANAYSEIGKPIGVTVVRQKGQMIVEIADLAADRDNNPRFDFYCFSGGNRLELDCGRDAAVFTDFAYRALEEPDGGQTTYANPVVDAGADGYILPDAKSGKYYFYATNAPAQGFRVYESTDLASWVDAGLCLSAENAAGTASATAGFWAPEVYAVGDAYYLFYSVDCRLAVAKADSPVGPFISGRGDYLIDHPAIDGSVFFDDDGKCYLYYVGWGTVPYGIYAREITFPYLTLGEERLILQPDCEWETVAGSVTEGPFIIKHDGVYYLTYSGTGYENPAYAVGYATSTDPLAGFTKYALNPILKQCPDQGVFGPGHHAFFQAFDGVWWIVYHRHNSEEQVHERTGCLDRIRFVKYPDEAVARLEVLGPTVTRQRIS